jgi:hypothetical protein
MMGRTQCVRERRRGRGKQGNESKRKNHAKGNRRRRNGFEEKGRKKKEFQECTHSQLLFQT